MFSFLLSSIAAFVLPVMNGQLGEVFDSSQHANKVLVIEAYFNDCPYCHQNAPKVDALAEEFAGEERVIFLDVGVDRNDHQYKSWIQKQNPNHPVLKDASRKLISQLGTKSYPSTYVIDCSGNVIFSTSGVWSFSVVERIANKINEATEKCL
jgi:peroxiredoxin